MFKKIVLIYVFFNSQRFCASEYYYNLICHNYRFFLVCSSHHFQTKYMHAYLLYCLPPLLTILSKKRPLISLGSIALLWPRQSSKPLSLSKTLFIYKVHVHKVITYNWKAKSYLNERIDARRWRKSFLFLNR